MASKLEIAEKLFPSDIKILKDYFEGSNPNEDKTYEHKDGNLIVVFRKKNFKKHFFIKEKRDVDKNFLWQKK